ncbi:MAG: class I SAM-dependent methyltransferase [Nitrospirales bacterium]|nr:class I SAM-dependent methyltransferase [Nitrospirales bacterium]
MNFILHKQDEHLQLIDQDEPSLTPFVIDFVSGKLDYRRKYGHAGGEAISETVGIKKGQRPNVGCRRVGSRCVCVGHHGMPRAYDRTLGHHWPTSGRHAGAREDKKIGKLIHEKLSLTCGDSQQVLLEVPFEPEVIYLDPMFPQKEKSALVKKDMRILQTVVEPDGDANALLKLAMTIATKAGSREAPGLCQLLAVSPPDLHQNKKHRFDIYLTKPNP